METDPAHESSDPSAHEARRLALFDRAERIGGLGSWEWIPQTGELLWSDNLFRLFGHEPGAVAPVAGRGARPGSCARPGAGRGRHGGTGRRHRR